MGEGGSVLDVAVVGAGAAGTYAAHELRQARPGWSIALYERTNRIGGRLHSRQIDGLDHPIELGGMRYLSIHDRVVDVMERFGIEARSFGGGVGFSGGPGRDRLVLRGVVGTGTDDPGAGAAYSLGAEERGRSAGDLFIAAFERIVPGALGLGIDDWVRVRATHRHGGRPITDWAIGEALASVLSPDGHRFVTDAFGYDSGLRGQNAGDAIPYVLTQGGPTARPLTPVDGMDRIPLALAHGFEARGGAINLEHEVSSLAPAGDLLRLTFADGSAVDARRVVLALAAPAFRLLADASPAMQSPAFRAVLESVDAWPAVKLYLWFSRPWWLDDFTGARVTTDLPTRKSFYFAGDPDRPATMLATYVDGRHTEPWLALADGATGGAPAPRPVLDAVNRYLGRLHPAISAIPAPDGSALMHWGADPHETGWHYWRAGSNSDDVIARAPKVDPDLELYLCGEAFSRAQAWVEGALQSAANVVDRILASTR